MEVDDREIRRQLPIPPGTLEAARRDPDLVPASLERAAEHIGKAGSSSTIRMRDTSGYALATAPAAPCWSRVCRTRRSSVSGVKGLERNSMSGASCPLCTMASSA